MHPRTLLRSFLDDLRARRFHPNMCSTAEVAVARFFEHLAWERVRDVRRVSEAHVMSFVRRLATLPSGRTGNLLAPCTQAAYLSAVRSFFRFLQSRGLVLHDPSCAVPLPKRSRLPRALSERRVRRLVSAPERSTIKGRRDRALLELLYGTGLRLSECVRLDLQDIDLDSGTLLVRDGKGHKDRYVPLSGEAARAIDIYLREARPFLERRSAEGSLFLSKYGRRLGSMAVRVLVRRYGESVGVKVSTHVLRHSYATHLLAGGASIRHIQELLGHKGIATTALYTKVDTRGLASMLRRCHPRERTKG